MTERTSNVLLKALEEPPPRTVWILCAPSEADLIPTIRSRVRTVRLRVPDVDEVAELISRRDGVSLPEATRAAREAQSHIGMAHRLATNEEARDRRRRTLELALGIRSVAGAVIAAGRAHRGRDRRREGDHRGEGRRGARQRPALARHRAGRRRASGAARAAEGPRGGPEAPRHPQPPRRDRPHPGRSAVAVPRHPAAAARGRAGAGEPRDLRRADAWPPRPRRPTARSRPSTRSPRRASASRATSRPRSRSSRC